MNLSRVLQPRIIGSALDLMEMMRSHEENIQEEDSDALYLLKTQIFVERNWEAAESLLCSLSAEEKLAFKSQLEQESDTKCLLHYAISNGATESLIVALLELNHEMFASYVDQYGDLPIHAAVRRGLSVPVICALIESYEGSSLTKKDRFGSMPLHISIINGKNMNLITFLLDQYEHSASIKNDNGDLPLHLAIKQDKITLEAIEALVKLNLKALITKDSTGRVPLLLAMAYDKNVPIISSLIKSCTKSARLKSDDGNLPIHAAVRWKRSLPIVVALVDSYSEGLQEPDGSGRLPLQIAIENKSDLEVLECLIELYPKAASIPNAFGDLPLVVAIMNNIPLGVISKLVEANKHAVFESNAINKMPLDVAIEKDAESSVIRLILEEYARTILSCDDPSHILRRKGNGGDLPLHAALRYEVSTSAVLRFIENYKTSCRIRGKFGELPLHVALRRISIDTLAVIGLLLAFPQALNIPTIQGDLVSHMINYECADEVLIRAVELPVAFWVSTAQNIDELVDCNFAVEVQAVFAMLQKNPSIKNGFSNSEDIDELRDLEDEVEGLRSELAEVMLNGIAASVLQVDANGEY